MTKEVAKMAVLIYAEDVQVKYKHVCLLSAKLLRHDINVVNKLLLLNCNSLVMIIYFSSIKFSDSTTRVKQGFVRCYFAFFQFSTAHDLVPKLDQKKLTDTEILLKKTPNVLFA